MSLTTAPSREQSPLRRVLGLLFGLAAAGLALAAIVLSMQNLYFHLTTQAVAGTVVQVQPGQPAVITVEYADINGQYRRVDQPWPTTPPPAKGADVRVWYQTDHPANARLADLSQLWGQAVLFAAFALAAGVVAEELLRRRGRRIERAG